MRLSRRKTGPATCAAARTACAVSRGSAGAVTVMFAMARIQAKSSMEWCVAPRAPYAIPLLTPTSFTFAFEYATSVLICSSARPVRKQAAEQTNGIFPAFASPAPTPTRFCSAMPTLISRSGKRSRNTPVLLDPTESLFTTTMRVSASPSATRVSEKASRQSYNMFMRPARRPPVRRPPAPVHLAKALCGATPPGPP